MESNDLDTRHSANFITDNRFVSNYTSNIKSDLIEITEDKLENILIKFLQNINTNQSWITPLSLFITIILVIITATFTEKFGIEKNTWEAIFYLSAFLTFLWTIYSGIKSYKNRNNTIQSIIKKIKNKEAN